MQSLKKTKSFKTVYNSGRKVVNHYFVAYAFANDEGINRLGVTVSKKVGNAVVRNRVRRLIKEVCRLKSYKIKKSYDIVIVARSTAGEIPKDDAFLKVDRAIESLFGRLRILLPEA